MRYLTLALALFFSATAHAQVTGNWYTILDAMGTKLPLGLTIEESAGGYAGTLSSPAQTAAKIPLSSVAFDGKKLAVRIASLGAGVDAVVDGNELRGVFSQAGADFPVRFTRSQPAGYPVGDDPVTIVARPQDPKDFPYLREAVTFPGGADGVTLAGELTLPQSGKPKAMLVLVSGSGPQDRNAYLGSQINHSPFLVLSDYLTRRGYGVLRYDDRGVAESTGDFATATSDDFARDAAAAVRYLRTDGRLTGVPLGVAGHSEGGMIAPVVATLDEELDFIVLMAAPAISIDSLMLDQRRRIAASMGQPAAFVERDEPALRAAYRWIKDNPTLPEADYVEGLYGVFEAQLTNLPPALQRSITDPRAFNAQYVRPLSSPWMRRFIAFEPADYLRNVNIPVLAINGLLDTQVDGTTNLNALARLMAISGNDQVSIVPLIGLNHLFQPAETGAPTEYGTIETTFDPTALHAIGQWLDERF